jgi:hypothetical protein
VIDSRGDRVDDRERDRDGWRDRELRARASRRESGKRNRGDSEYCIVKYRYGVCTAHDIYEVIGACTDTVYE